MSSASVNLIPVSCYLDIFECGGVSYDKDLVRALKSYFYLLKIMPYICGVIFVLLNLLLISTITEQKRISPDSKRLYHDIVSGRGLYFGFDKFEELNNTNFKSVVFNKTVSKVWLVEFYNSWCGHCHRFAPTWKGLAADIYGKKSFKIENYMWVNVVLVGFSLAY